MLRSNKAQVHLVYEMDKCVSVIGGNLKDAKRDVITRVLHDLDESHYNPCNRYVIRKDKISLSKDAVLKWDDLWEHKGTTDYSIHTWFVNGSLHDVTNCTLDAYIKTHVAENQLSWIQIKDLFKKWRTLSNYEMFYDTCFSSIEKRWSHEMPREKWMSSFHQIEYESRNVAPVKPNLTRHMSLTIRAS